MIVIIALSPTNDQPVYNGIANFQQPGRQFNGVITDVYSGPVIIEQGTFV